MATLRLTPSTYQLSSTSYLSITNANNMYTNVDSTTYATVNHSRSATTAYYIYVRGFDFSQIPSNATINSAIVKVKAYVQSAGSATPALYNRTTSLSKNLDGTIGTSATTRTVDITSNWETYKEYGSNFGIRLQLNRSSRNTASYLYIYGAEIYVDYTLKQERTITVSVTGNVDVTPSGTTTVYDGDSFTLTMSALNKPQVMDNSILVTSQVTEQSPTGSISSSPTTYSTSGNISGTNYQSAVGKGSDTTTTSTQNDYCSSSGSTAYIEYRFDLSEVPTGATIQSVECSVKGHCENASQSTEVAKLQLYSGSTAKGSSTDFTSTSNTVVNLTTGTWTRSELDNLRLRFTIGYYGGLVLGATVTVTYEIETDGVIYVYTISSVTSNHTVIVYLEDQQEEPYIYVKENGHWEKYLVYKKVDSVWVKQADPDTTLLSTIKYILV